METAFSAFFCLVARESKGRLFKAAACLELFYPSSSIACRRTAVFLRICALFALGSAAYLWATPSTNVPPQVSITYPHAGDGFGASMWVKIKVDASDADGSIAQVQFWVESQLLNRTNLIGIVTNAPYELWWEIDTGGPVPYGGNGLRAVAVDNFGAATTSAPVWIGVSGGPPPFLVFEITSPPNNTLLLPAAAFDFSVEPLAGWADDFILKFYAGTNFLGSITNRQHISAVHGYSVAVSNLVEGQYLLNLRVLPGEVRFEPVSIRVAPLGVRSARVTPEGGFQFETVTAFPGQDHIVEISTNLLLWTTLSTNVPASNLFTFIEPIPRDLPQRFYRVVVP